MEEVKDQLYKKGKDLIHENMHSKALKWLFFFI